jgi:hypothetical protein
MARRVTGNQEVYLSVYLTHLLFPAAGLIVRFLLGAHELNVKWECRVVCVCMFLGFATLYLLHGIWSKDGSVGIQR